MNDGIAGKAKDIVLKAAEKIKQGKEESTTYKELFDVEGEDATKNGKDKNRLFMIGNPRGYVRC